MPGCSSHMLGLESFTSASSRKSISMSDNKCREHLKIHLYYILNHVTIHFNNRDDYPVGSLIRNSSRVLSHNSDYFVHV
jgi:hypothetical protein